jgi:hypothetical protein
LSGVRDRHFRHATDIRKSQRPAVFYRTVDNHHQRKSLTGFSEFRKRNLPFEMGSNLADLTTADMSPGLLSTLFHKRHFETTHFY